MKTKFDFEPRWVVVLIFFLAGTFLGGLGVFTYVYNGSYRGVQKIHPASGQGYKYINPLLAIDTESSGQFFENKKLETKFASLIQKKSSSNGVSQVSIYFRDLEAGKWTAINDDYKFSPGLLLKIPIMIAYFKNAEADVTILNRPVTYVKSKVKSTARTLIDGHEYTIGELIHIMLVEDDDAAAELLYNIIDKDSLNAVYSDLGINFKEDLQSYDFLSNKTYALLFRILYNSTYLNREYSEKALAILDEIPDTDGIGLVVPRGSAVAHTYRDRIIDTKTFESYDCGLVYFPDHPYVLCMIITGRSLSEIRDTLRQLAQIAYDDMSEQYKAN